MARLEVTPGARDESVTCWGWGGKGCECTIPNTHYETMKAHGWGFTLQNDAGAPANHDGSMGLGNFYACPEHKDKGT